MPRIGLGVWLALSPSAQQSDLSESLSKIVMFKDQVTTSLSACRAVNDLHSSLTFVFLQQNLDQESATESRANQFLGVPLLKRLCPPRLTET